jgi:solute carrier family 25 carnitine/acylcarnitine transporter 20/29
MDTFIAGFAYGATSVLVGQPLDTLKTRMQTLNLNRQMTSIELAKDIFRTEGVAGLYRGGLPLFIGGGLIRSSQFGVYNNCLAYLQEKYGPTRKEDRLLTIFDPQIIFSGFLGGIGRGLVESPFEFFKTRRQIYKSWQFKEIFSGSGTTIFRNSFLFSSFVIYLDISKLVVEGGLGPFWSGAICANLAWLTIWPLDVVKSQVQSGQHAGKSLAALLVENFRNRTIYNGIAPGLLRSFISNGCSMVVYTKVMELLSLRNSKIL